MRRLPTKTSPHPHRFIVPESGIPDCLWTNSAPEDVGAASVALSRTMQQRDGKGCPQRQGALQQLMRLMRFRVPGRTEEYQGLEGFSGYTLNSWFRL